MWDTGGMSKASEEASRQLDRIVASQERVLSGFVSFPKVVESSHSPQGLPVRQARVPRTADLHPGA